MIHQVARPSADLEVMPFAPRRYVAYRAASGPDVDGKLDGPAWKAAQWSEPFVDIDGDARRRRAFAPA
jgi:hypothetical protein